MSIFCKCIYWCICTSAYIYTYIYIYYYNYLDPPRSTHRAWSQGFPLRIGVLRCDELHLGEEIRQMLDVVADDKPWCFNIAMEAMAHRNRWFSQRTKPPFILGIFHGYVSHNHMVSLGICIPNANHGAGIWIPTFPRTKSPRFVGKYTSTMEHMGRDKL